MSLGQYACDQRPFAIKPSWCDPSIKPPVQAVEHEIAAIVDDLTKLNEQLRSRLAQVLKPYPHGVTSIGTDLSERSPIRASISKLRAAVYDLNGTAEAIDL